MLEPLIFAAIGAAIIAVAVAYGMIQGNDRMRRTRRDSHPGLGGKNV